MLDHALDYASRGYAVFPCKADKTPYTLKGVKDASTDPDLIRQWWMRWPHAMIGMAMGKLSGIWVLDPDAPKGDGPDGRANWRRLVTENGGGSCLTQTNNTPGGGQHLLFAYDDARPINNSRGDLKGLGIDVRGNGGYIIAPPSINGEGLAYEIEQPMRPIAPAPDWLYEMILTTKAPPLPTSTHAAQPSIRQQAFDNVVQLQTANRNERTYSESALNRECDALAAIRKGSRNEALNTAALKLGQLVGPGRLEEGEVRSRLEQACVANGLEADGKAAVLKTINSGLYDGMKTPRVIPPCAQAQQASAIIADAEVMDNGAITQDGIGRAFADRYKDRLRYDHHAGAWYEWTGTHWAKDEKSRAYQFVRELGRDFTEGASIAITKEVRKSSFASGVEKFARCDPALSATSETWDRDPFLLGTPAGTVDLRTGKLREPDPAHAITKLTSVAPADTADCPLWLKFLNQTFDGDAPMIRFAQQWAGYNLTGDIREHALLFGTGNGGNGKGVWLNVHANILKDYAKTATMETFISSSMDRHTTDVAMLRGARMVTATETDEGRQWAEARIKQLTGGDFVTARLMRQDNITFKPNFKLTIVGNHKPVLRNVDDAARRRFNIIPFNRKPATPDRELEQKLMAEAPAILRWMIDGCLDWQANGLVRPASVVAATAEYFEDQDLMSKWLEDECDADPGNEFKWEPIAVLFKSWSDYCQAAGEKVSNSKSLGTQLVRRDFVACRKDGKRSYAGLRLRLVPSHNEPDAEQAEATKPAEEPVGPPKF
jgi:putative DNA primase/helicase